MHGEARRAVRYHYSPETFSQTEPEIALETCEAVKKTWGKACTAYDQRVIFNLQATVEICPPNHYADLVRASDRYVLTER